jgi:hypothetical protein
MMCKVNSDDEMQSIFNKAAVLWLKGEKKRRGINDVYTTLYEEGLLNHIPQKRMVRWKEGKDDEEKESKEIEDRIIFSSLYMIKQNEESPDNVSKECLDNETTDDLSSDSQPKKKKPLSTKKRRKKTGGNRNINEEEEEEDEEIRAIEISQLAKKKIS